MASSCEMALELLDCDNGDATVVVMMGTPAKEVVEWECGSFKCFGSEAGWLGSVVVDDDDDADIVTPVVASVSD